MARKCGGDTNVAAQYLAEGRQTFTMFPSAVYRVQPLPKPCSEPTYSDHCNIGQLWSRNWTVHNEQQM